MEEPVVHINDYGSFTEEHLAIAKTLSNKKEQRLLIVYMIY